MTTFVMLASRVSAEMSSGEEKGGEEGEEWEEWEWERHRTPLYELGYNVNRESRREEKV